MYTRTASETLRGVPPVVTGPAQHGQGAVCRRLCVLLGGAGRTHEFAVLSVHHMYTRTVWDTPSEGFPLLPQVQPSMARELFSASFVSCWAELEETIKLQFCLCMTCTHAHSGTPSEGPPTGLLLQVQPSMARELFAAGFVSCWAELEEPMREALVRSLEAALASPSIPPEIVTTLLNLAEFMEHNEKKLPLDTRQVWLLSSQSALCWGRCRAVSCRMLGAVAEKCHAVAKALHYKEHA